MDSCTSSPPVGRSLRVLLVEDSDVLAQRLNEAIGHLSGIHLIGVTDTEAVSIDVAEHQG